MLATLARFLFARRWFVIAGAVVVGSLAGGIGGSVAGKLKAAGFDDPRSQSTQARDRAIAASGVDTQNIVALVTLGGPAGSADARARLDHVVAVFGAEPDIAQPVITPALDPSLVSQDGRSAQVIGFWRNVGDDEEVAAAHRVEKALAGDPDVKVGGSTLAQDGVGQQVSADLAKAEAIAFPILLVLLIVVFRSLVAAVLPLLVGGLTVGLTLFALDVTNAFTPLSIYALNLVTGLGLGLAIDYSLLIVSRFREELEADASVAAALRRTLTTAGRTVLFSSLTVTVALAALLLFPQRFLYSMGFGGMFVTISAAAVALVLLPAVLAALGHRVNSLSWRRAAASGRGAWYRIAHLVQRRSLLVALTTGAVLIIAGLPFTRIQFTSVDASDLPETYAARQVNDIATTQFNTQHLDPVTMVITAPSSAARQVAAYAQSVRAVPSVTSTSAPRALDATTWTVDAYIGGDPLSATDRDAVQGIRALPAPFPVLVGGRTAAFIDLQTSLIEHLPAAFILIAVATVVVLFAATGSVVLPVKSLLMNVLSLSATFGLLVLIFQDGRFQDLLGYTSQGALESTQPILLFAIAFGLSTDYGVFLLIRIKEARDAGAPTREAVATGIERTGRIVTAAALLFCVAIGAFATSQIIFIKILGVGTALAVLIDSSIVRALLVPALMDLLGEWNWWAPRPLRRLHHALRLDHLKAAPAPAESPAA
jgi:uncharacterized membrane protein YdfJ with MMPL/SSD domain